MAAPGRRDHLVAVRHGEDLEYAREHDEPFVCTANAESGARLSQDRQA
ncbi:hypothetical protein [Streptomyces adustus]|nr:hypothetical protein [Streptomyces adustus]